MLYIITPCSRPENLNRIYESIPEQCQWVISHDDSTNPSDYSFNNVMFMNCKNTGMVGTRARNYALDNLPLLDDDHIYFLDDDNIIHPKWYPKISQHLDLDFSIMMWGQYGKNNTIRLPPPTVIEVGAIDTACYLIKWKYNTDVRHRTDTYTHDGIYAIDCAHNGPNISIDDCLCYYNYLR